MKTLADGTQVSSKSYYYLLEFNEDDNWQFMKSQFDKDRLKDLTIKEYRLLFNLAAQEEFKTTETPETMGMILIGSGISRQEYMKINNHILATEFRLETKFETKPLNLELDFAKLEQAKLEQVLLETVIDPFDKPPKRNRPESNKDFKKAIRNLTNNQSKNVPILRTSHKGNRR